MLTNLLFGYKIVNGHKSPNEKVDAFADQLENVFKPNNTSSYISSSVTYDYIPNPLKFRLFAVKSAVKSFKWGKSPGNDKITVNMFNFLSESGLKFILFIFNAILRSGYFPISWNLSEIVMISKPRKDVCHSSNILSTNKLLSILSKLFEKMLFEGLLTHLNIQ